MQIYTKFKNFIKRYTIKVVNSKLNFEFTTLIGFSKKTFPHKLYSLTTTFTFA